MYVGFIILKKDGWKDIERLKLLYFNDGFINIKYRSFVYFISCACRVECERRVSFYVVKLEFDSWNIFNILFKNVNKFYNNIKCIFKRLRFY